jgi:hypothetical protein
MVGIGVKGLLFRSATHTTLALPSTIHIAAVILEVCASLSMPDLGSVSIPLVPQGPTRIPIVEPVPLGVEASILLPLRMLLLKYRMVGV